MQTHIFSFYSLLIFFMTFFLFSWTAFFKICTLVRFAYLFESQREGERERKKEEKSSIGCATPHRATKAKGRPDWSQESGPGAASDLPAGTRVQAFGPPSVSFLGSWTGEWLRNGSAGPCKCYVYETLAVMVRYRARPITFLFIHQRGISSLIWGHYYFFEVFFTLHIIFISLNSLTPFTYFAFLSVLNVHSCFQRGTKT